VSRRATAPASPLHRHGRSARRLTGFGLRVAAIAACSLALAGCAVFDPEVTPAPSASPLTSGIRGIVHVGPTCEGATRASPCIEPYSARLIVLDANDDVVGDLLSAIDGTFQMALPPGIYTIQPAPPENGDPFPIGQTISVVVGDGEYTEVGVDYDTGMR
jgi:hypothetical protein